MRIQVDTTFKTITVLDDVTFRELFKALSQLFPEEGWMDYKLLRLSQTGTTPFVAPWVTHYGDTTNVPWNGLPTTTTHTPNIGTLTLGNTSNSVFNIGQQKPNKVFNVDYNDSLLP